MTSNHTKARYTLDLIGKISQLAEVHNKKSERINIVCNALRDAPLEAESLRLSLSIMISNRDLSDSRRKTSS